MSPTAPRIAGLICAGCVSWAGMDFRPAAVVIGVTAAVLVRVPLWKPKTKWWVEASVTLMGALGAFVTISDHGIGPGNAFWVGILFGAVASSLLEIGKGMARSVVLDRIKAALRILFDMRGDDR